MPVSTSTPASRCGSSRGAGPVATGVAVEIPPGQAGLVLPRSGFAARHGVALVNAPGLIDSGYRGELRVLLLNTDPTRRSSCPPATGSPSSSSSRAHARLEEVAMLDSSDRARTRLRLERLAAGGSRLAARGWRLAAAARGSCLAASQRIAGSTEKSCAVPKCSSYTSLTTSPETTTSVLPGGRQWESTIRRSAAAG